MFIIQYFLLSILRIPNPLHPPTERGEPHFFFYWVHNIQNNSKAAEEKKRKGLVGITASHNSNILFVPRGCCYSCEGLKRKARLAGRHSIFHLTSLYSLI